MHVQRAVFAAVLSFMFFLTMMFAFYVLRSPLYFLLSTAFLIVYLITMFSIVLQRRSNLEIYENGLKYKKKTLLWHQVKGVQPSGAVEAVDNRKNLQLPTTLTDLDRVVATIRQRSEAAG